MCFRNVSVFPKVVCSNGKRKRRGGKGEERHVPKGRMCPREWVFEKEVWFVKRGVVFPGGVLEERVGCVFEQNRVGHS